MVDPFKLRNHTLMAPTLSDEQVLRIVRADHWDPFSVLGPHLVDQAGSPCMAIRTFQPTAQEAWVVEAGGQRAAHAMTRIHKAGLFEAILPGRSQAPRYQVRTLDSNGQKREFPDPYAFGPRLTDFDLHLIGEGTHYKNYEKLGAHMCEMDGVSGVCFAVWAPNARRVSVIGDFNNWDARCHLMRVHPGTGVWELFVPGLNEGALYKFQIRSQVNDYEVQKADPYAFFFEVRPRSASIAYHIDGYAWHDEEWMARRAERNWFESPVAVYEVHLGSWRRGVDQNNRFLTYREIAEQLVAYVRHMGYTHIELLPVMEHPFDGSWGYQTLGYFAPTSRFGAPDDFKYLVDLCHQNDIGVILDWAPAHFPDDPHGLASFDGTCLYEHADPKLGKHSDWDTLIFNYGRNEVANFLLTSALFWLDKYHADGLRVDAVASMLYLDYSRKPGEWVPNRYGGNENLEAIAFIKRFNELTHDQYPGVLTIAEESTAWPSVSRPVYLGGLGFDLKWNMGWMNDMLEYFCKKPIHRKYHHGNLTFSLLYAFTENFSLVLSHDEVVHGKQAMLSKMPGDTWQQFADLRAFYAFMYGHPGKKLLFMGGEFGQWIEWNHDQQLDWLLLDFPVHQQLQQFVGDLNRLYRSEPALYEVDFHYEGFEWIDFHDTDGSAIAFLRRARDSAEHVVVLCNFTPVPRYGYRVGVPEGSFYRELINSDAACYGGSNLGNHGGMWAEPIPWQGRPFSLNLTLPPLGVVFLKPQRET